jgi:hypothetical protein
MAAALGCTIGMAPSFLDFTFFRGIIHPPAHKAEGLGCANDQIPKRDRQMASPLSSAQQPMDQVF